MRPTVRDPVAAGSFYPANADELRRAIEALLDGDGARRSYALRAPAPTRLLLAPHAALVRSGVVAAAAHASALTPPLVVILSPDHHGVGAGLAVPRAGSWRSPLGRLEIDEVATGLLLDSAGSGLPLRDDWRAHSRDHATELQLPFLQVAAGRQGREQPRLVTLSCGDLAVETLIATGEAVASMLIARGAGSVDAALLLVSADLSQGLPASEVREADAVLLELMQRCDAEGLAAHVRGRGVPTCALPPLVVGLVAARRLGVGTGEILAHETSADRGGASSSAVGYAAIRWPSG